MLTKKDRQEIAAMFVELMNSVPDANNIVKVQASKPDTKAPAGLLDACKWLKESKDWAKNAAKIVFTNHEKAVYFYLTDSKGKRLGERNRQLRKSSKGFYSIPFGTHKLQNTSTVSL